MIVKFFPKSEVTATIKDHKYGADLTVTECTDARYKKGIEMGEMYAFRHGMRAGVFSSKFVGDYNAPLGVTEGTGCLAHDLYFITSYWKDPTTGIVGLIPDILSTTWTQAGVDAFGATLGEAKATLYPLHGQDMYDLTSGALGYNYTTGTAGASNQAELVGSVDFQINWLTEQKGSSVSAFSYSGGLTAYKTSLLPYFVGARGSTWTDYNAANFNTFYGVGLGFDPTVAASLTRSRMADVQNSFRFWEALGQATEANVLAKVNTELGKTITNNGWYRDFIHWHNLVDANDIDALNRYFNQVATSLAGAETYFCSHGEAMEYLFLRSISKRVSAFEMNGQVNIVVDVVDSFKDVVTDGISNALSLPKIRQSLSVEVDLTGTSLEGKKVVSTSGELIPLGGDLYIVQVPFSQREMFQGVSIIEGQGGLLSLDTPTFTEDLNGNILTIRTSQPTKAVLFLSDTVNDIDFTPSIRSNSFGYTHTFDTLGKNYKVGVISQTGKTNLAE